MAEGHYHVEMEREKKLVPLFCIYGRSSSAARRRS
jgi:hypothetical protein